MTLADAAQRFAQAHPAARRVDFRGETTFALAPGEIKDALSFAKDTLGFDFLTDVSSVDNFGDEPRYEVVYELYSLAERIHLRLRCALTEDEAEAAALPTVSDLWKTADWHEREIYDMMGIRFGAHPDLRRILMWDGYPYFPLRKDFPLEGKGSDVPEVAFTAPAPLAGGPFVTTATNDISPEREPRAKDFGMREG